MAEKAKNNKKPDKKAYKANGHYKLDEVSKTNSYQKSNKINKVNSNQKPNKKAYKVDGGYILKF